MNIAALDVAHYRDGVLAAERAVLARAITLVESSRPDHRDRAEELLEALLPHAGGAHRVGISGVPGAGKSTLVDELGTRLTEHGHRVAVLAVDPSSTRTGGSILADKTRMGRLANDPNAYIRPSPTAGTLGGVAAATREALVVCEAAGFDVVLVETVGVGQSEVAVAGMVDCFTVLALPRSGDSVQGMKRGILELADIVAVNKADGGYESDALATARQIGEAFSLFPSRSSGWRPEVHTCSGLTGGGVDALWAAVERHHRSVAASGELERRRADQDLEWMWATVTERVLRRLRRNPAVEAVLPGLEDDVRAHRITPAGAARRLLGVL